MEKTPSQEEPELLTFYCHLCSVSCASALNLQSHFLGIKHRKVEEALRNNVVEKDKDEVEDEPIDLKPNVTLQEHIDACKNSEPAVGLEYIYQYQRHGFNTYECKLCQCRAGLTHMFMHIVGAKHRMNYLGKHHPSLGICGPYIMRGPKKLKKLRDVCLTVEKEFGRKKINVLDGQESLWAFTPDITAASSVYYNQDSELGKMDFTSDDFFNTNDKPKDTEDQPKRTRRVITFLELKAAHEAKLKKTEPSSDNIEHNSGAQEEHTEKNEATDGDSTNTPEKEVQDTELCKSNKDFKSNRELFNYLERFSIVEQADAKFVKTVLEMLAIALLRHHKGCKRNKEKDLSTESRPDDSTEQDKCKKQDPDSSVLPPHTEQEPEQSKTQLIPIPKASERKKLIFTLPLNKAQESVVKIKPSHKPNGPTSTFNPTANVFSADRESEDDESEDAPEMPSEKSPAPQPDNRKQSSESKPSSSRASDSKSHYEIRRQQQQHHGLQREMNSSVRGLSQGQTPVYPAPQVNRGAPFSQTRFAPPRAPFPPRPPLFPIAQDDVINKFFESIKNMEVSEVASTLSKITATNPAFKGIHVPSLIRYLTETGKLKATQGVQELDH